MANLQSLQVTNRMPIPTGDTATEPVVIVSTFVVPAGLAGGDIVEMGPLMNGYVPVDLMVAFPDMDTGTAIAFDAGMLSGNWLDTGARTIGSEFFAAVTTAQAGGVARLNKAAGMQIAPATNDRSWGLKVGTAATVLTAGGTITATFTVRPKIEGI